MPQVAAAVEALDPVHVAGVMADGGEVGINVDGDEHTIGADEVTLALQPLEGYEVEAEAGHAVALQLELDDELRREGLAREIVHAVQNARKEAGLEITDRIELSLGGDEELLEAAREPRALRRRRGARHLGRLRRRRRRDRRSIDGRELRDRSITQSRVLGDSPMMKSVFGESENFTQQCSGAAPATSTSAASIRLAISAFCSSVRPSNQWMWTNGIARAPPLGERRLQLGLEAPLRHRPDDFLGDRPVLEEEQGRDQRTSYCGRGLLVLVDVEADDLQVLALGVDLLEDRVDDAAGTAPGRPEVDEHGALGLQDVGLEGGVGHVGELAGHWYRSPESRGSALNTSESIARRPPTGSPDRSHDR